MADTVFEYLAIRIEVERGKLSKEPNSESVGRVKELSSILDIFAPAPVKDL